MLVHGTIFTVMKMRKKLIVCLLLFSVGLVACGTGNKKSDLSSLEHLTFDQLDEKLAANESFVVYFGWTENCGDSEQFQKGYLEKKIQTDDEFKKIYVVDLDKELPDGLSNKDARKPMKDKYDVYASPTMVQYVDGKMGKKIEWTTLNSSDKTGILESELDAYFTEIGLLK